MNWRKFVVLAAAGAGAVPLGVLTADVAMADPAGCGSDKPKIAKESSLHGWGRASCDRTAFRYYTGEIKWDKNAAPDPLVAKESMSGESRFKIDVYTCDKGNRRKYYARTYFNSTSGDHHDSDHKTLTAC